MRWPVVLKPKPLESLSSWLERHAKYYKVSMETLFASGLRMSPPKNIIEVDFFSIHNLYNKIEKFTGVKEDTLNKMVISSMVPKVFDKLDIHTRKDFEDYVNTFIVFYCIGKRQLVNTPTTYTNLEFLPWVSETPWSKQVNSERFCPQCVINSGGYKLLLWRFCILSTCPEHKCFLVEKKIFQNKKRKKHVDENFKFNIEDMQPENELLKLDSMTLNAFKYGYVNFSNGDKMQDMIWFRFLRGLVKQLCIIRRRNYEVVQLNLYLDKKIQNYIDYNTHFECLEQYDRITIMTAVGGLILDWPNEFISKLHPYKSSKFPYFLRKKIPYSLAKYIDIYMTDEDIRYSNPDFKILCDRLKFEGLNDEMTLELQKSLEARENMFKMLTYNNSMSAEDARILIENICNQKKNRAGATVYDKSNKHHSNSFRELSSNCSARSS